MNGQTVEVSGFAPQVWSWVEATTPVPVSSSGIYTLSLWMREDGLRIDRLLLTTDTNYIPTGFGPTATALTSITTTLTRTIIYTYDTLYRLTEADYSTGEFFGYTYDERGNRLSQTTLAGTNVYTYDAANRLVEVDGQSYSWDNNGNLLNDGQRTFTYDPANRLATITGDITATYEYNGDGDRYAQTVNGLTTDYVLDPVGLAQVLVETQSGQSDFYLPGLAQYNSSNGWSYYAQDRLGSTRQLIDPTGALMQAQTFDPFGNVLEQTSTAQSIFNYTGEQTDPTGLVFLRARYYDPSVGRFLTADTVVPDPLRSAGWNGFAYVGNNSINYVDPSGHCWGPMSFLRNTPYYDTTCDNLDMAILIAGHPDATAYEKAQAVAYVEAVAVSHIVLGEALMMVGYGAYTTIASVCTPACADGDCTNEIRATSHLLPQLGNKLDFIFGQATGNVHNIARSQSMLAQLRKIGLSDTPATRRLLEGHFAQVLNDPNNIVKVQENGRILRESFLIGPLGGLKIQSIWEGSKLITVMLFGGG